MMPKAPRRGVLRLPNATDRILLRPEIPEFARVVAYREIRQKWLQGNYSLQTRFASGISCEGRAYGFQ